MIIQRENNSKFLELTKFCAQQVVINMEMGQKAFDGIKNDLISFNRNCLNNSVNAKLCFDFCKSVVHKLGLHGLELIISGDKEIYSQSISTPPLNMVNHLVPERWIILVVPATESTKKLISFLQTGYILINMNCRMVFIPHLT